MTDALMKRINLTQRQTSIEEDDVKQQGERRSSTSQKERERGRERSLEQIRPSVKTNKN